MESATNANMCVRMLLRQENQVPGEGEEEDSLEISLALQDELMSEANIEAEDKLNEAMEYGWALEDAEWKSKAEEEEEKMRESDAAYYEWWHINEIKIPEDHRYEDAPVSDHPDLRAYTHSEIRKNWEAQLDIMARNVWNITKMTQRRIANVVKDEAHLIGEIVDPAAKSAKEHSTYELSKCLYLWQKEILEGTKKLIDEAMKKKKARTKVVEVDFDHYYKLIHKVDDVIMHTYLEAHTEYKKDLFKMDTSEMREATDCLDIMMYVTVTAHISERIKDIRYDMASCTESGPEQEIKCEREHELRTFMDKLHETVNFKMGPNPKVPEFGKKPPTFNDLFRIKADFENLQEYEKETLAKNPYKNEEGRSAWLVATNIQGEHWVRHVSLWINSTPRIASQHESTEEYEANLSNLRKYRNLLLNASIEQVIARATAHQVEFRRQKHWEGALEVHREMLKIHEKPVPVAATRYTRVRTTPEWQELTQIRKKAVENFTKSEIFHLTLEFDKEDLVFAQMDHEFKVAECEDAARQEELHKKAAKDAVMRGKTAGDMMAATWPFSGLNPKIYEQYANNCSNWFDTVQRATSCMAKYGSAHIAALNTRHYMNKARTHLHKLNHHYAQFTKKLRNYQEEDYKFFTEKVDTLKRKRDDYSYESNEAEKEKIEEYSDDPNDEFNHRGFPKYWDWDDEDNWESCDTRKSSQSSSSWKNAPWNNSRGLQSWEKGHHNNKDPKKSVYPIKVRKSKGKGK